MCPDKDLCHDDDLMASKKMLTYLEDPQGNYDMVNMEGIWDQLKDNYDIFKAANEGEAHYAT